MEIELPNRFTPRAYQVRPMRYLDNGGKRAVWVVHRRGGKDLTLLHQTCKMAHERRGAYWHVFPSGEQGRKAIWEGFTKDGQRIMDLVFPREIRKSPRSFEPNAEMVVQLKCGSLWRLIGSDHMEVVGAGPVGVVFSEFAQARPKTWDLVRPMLRENGGWAAFISTPRGKNHLWRLLEAAKADPSWFWDVQTLLQTRAYDPEGTLEEERASGMPEELIEQEYLCSFTAALVGSIFGKLLSKLAEAGRIGPFDHSGRDVSTIWDLGIDDANAIWFAQVSPDRRGVDVIDCYQARGEPLSHYIDVLEQRGYSYTKHFLPHDARHRNLLTGGTVEDACRERLGSNKVAVLPAASIADGIQAGRWLLQQPSTRFHARCDGDPEGGLESLRAYSYAYDEEKKTYSRRPLHNWASHYGDGWRYTGLVARTLELVTRPAPAPETPVLKPYTLNDAMRAMRQQTRRM